MEQESDFNLREVKRLTNFITNLISNISTSNKNELENGIRETDDFIRKEWDLSLKEIVTFSEFNFMNKLKELNEIHIEKLAELLSEIIKKMNTPEIAKKYNQIELAKKGVLLINSLNDKSKTYSIKRMELKHILQKYIES
ncbi:hypothetical protein [Polaribacter sp. HL-MS24]|uniref:hypothetical protein n=1 Tax=Polaribacter sp. HL-MS24 TaxID=3077735 RepID=UPI0029345F20|nr:hypothetical protein [Polaribacter sp. HL-MS24]WOC39711.1 hypothetical protein RRF69_08590 [Polaribacter sp. HL-MS24]